MVVVVVVVVDVGMLMIVRHALQFVQFASHAGGEFFSVGGVIVVGEGVGREVVAGGVDSVVFVRGEERGSFSCECSCDHD